MSALPPKADIDPQLVNGSEVPQADIAPAVGMTEEAASGGGLDPASNAPRL